MCVRKGLTASLACVPAALPACTDRANGEVIPVVPLPLLLNWGTVREGGLRVGIWQGSLCWGCVEVGGGGHIPVIVVGEKVPHLHYDPLLIHYGCGVGVTGVPYW